ncbi:hypothetical protein OBBRIDRAFT_801170 [Obba rivulosa]|uniref:Uncharacterized protein n=1 Tax=Obba rivulosa TaxID=1052685 RepID=A0A8E2J6R1_9APHY|nr:hypothetical protein OBBRIDRAFT_801170 [Obba rivulosa]
MPTYYGVSIEVVYDGQTLEEFGVIIGDQTTFYIKEHKALDQTVTFDCFIDKHSFNGMLCDPGAQTKDEGLRAGRNLVRPFTFVGVKTTHNGALAAAHVRKEENIGLIEIHVLRVQRGRSVNPVKSPRLSSPKQIQGWPQCTVSREAMPVEMDQEDVTYIDPSNYPYAVFMIRYGHEGIIPSHTPAPLPVISAPFTPNKRHLGGVHISSPLKKRRRDVIHDVGVKVEYDESIFDKVCPT